MFEQFHFQVETDIIFDIKMVVTDKLNRRGGLGTDLLRRSVQLANSLGYKASGFYICVRWLVLGTFLLEASKSMPDTWLVFFG